MRSRPGAELPAGRDLARLAITGNVKGPFMDTYASHQNLHGWSCTVVCTLAQGRVLLPLGPGGALISVTGTQTGQGNWMRVEKNLYAFTAWRILTDPDGKAAGWAQFWGRSDRTRRIISRGDRRRLLYAGLRRTADPVAVNADRSGAPRSKISEVRAPSARIHIDRH